MLNKIKIVSWVDFCFLLTIAYSIFLICGFLISFDCRIEIFGKEYNTTANLFTWIQTTNPDLEKWKLWVLLISMFVLALMLDIWLIKPLLFRTTKLYKIQKFETLKKYKELKNEKQ